MSQDEQIDIVDEDLKGLYSEWKFKAHKQGLLHKCVIGEVRDKNGNWVLIEQAGDRQDPGQFVSPVGGHVKASESDEEALKREAKEEIGITKFKFEKVGAKIFHRSVIGRDENHYFVVYIIYPEEELVAGEEGVGFETFSTEDLKKQIKKNPKKFGGAWHFLIQNFYPALLQGWLIEAELLKFYSCDRNFKSKCQTPLLCRL